MEAVFKSQLIYNGRLIRVPTRRFEMSAEKPTAGFVLSLIGGIIIFLVGLAIIAIAVMVNAIVGSSGVPFPTFSPITMGLETIGIIGAVTGLLVIVGGVLMYVRPQQHAIWGVLVLVISIVSIFGGGGIILGLVLGVVGGILGIVFKPSSAMPMAPSMGPPPAQ
jgi:Family of unknown function (DUF6114)